MLWSRFRDLRDLEAREALILMHLPYAKAVAAGLYGSHSYHEAPFAEYVQCATLGLIECIDRYDPAHGAKFRTYAHLRMRGAINDGLAHTSEHQEQRSLYSRLSGERMRAARADTGLREEEVEDAQLLSDIADIGVSLMIGFMLEDTGMVLQPDSMLPDGCYESAALHELKGRLHASIPYLTLREQSVVRLHYLQGMTYELVSQALGITRGRVAQLHAQALRKLRRLIAPELS